MIESKLHSLLTEYKDVTALFDLLVAEVAELHEIKRSEIAPRVLEQLEGFVTSMKIETSLAKEVAESAYEKILEEPSDENILSNLDAIQSAKDDLKASGDSMLAKLREFKSEACENTDKY
ncbi:hypothetical protein TorRG33x02_098580 [Trema orientale]|uniref:Uncharacterized protein n=1 Tax=Trema orientale TaxID=63057 RepID=A0A2P5F9E6_TREOI|nr:hypothetical protein TorRG33x02_098580 [Trema orientale]